MRPYFVAPYDRSNAAISMKPQSSSALQRGESLRFGFTFGSAPLSNRILTAAMSPLMIAQRRGVILKSSNSFKSAPRNDEFLHCIVVRAQNRIS